MAIGLASGTQYSRIYVRALERRSSLAFHMDQLSSINSGGLTIDLNSLVLKDSLVLKEN